MAVVAPTFSTPRVPLGAIASGLQAPSMWTALQIPPISAGMKFSSARQIARFFPRLKSF